MATVERKQVVRFESREGLNCYTDQQDISIRKSSTALNSSPASGSQRDVIKAGSPMPSISSRPPFKATMIWNQIVEELKVCVVVKKRRITRGHCERCFSGSDAVDIVYRYLTTHESQFDPKQVTREKASKLCQLLIDFQIVTCVRPQDSRKFEDGHINLYKFLVSDTDETASAAVNPTSPTSSSSPASADVNPPHTSGSTGEETDQFMECDVIGNRALLQHKSKSTLQLKESSPLHRLNYGSIWKRHSTECVSVNSRPASPLTNRLYRRTSLPFCSALGSECNRPISPDEPESDERELIRESALSHLLLIVDLPVLDGISNYTSATLRSRRRLSAGAVSLPSAVAYVNLAAVQQFDDAMSPSNTSFSQQMGDSCTTKSRDVWWSLAVECLEALMTSSASVANPCILTAISDLISSVPSTNPVPDWFKLELFSLQCLLVGQPHVVIRTGHEGGLSGLRNVARVGQDCPVWPEVFGPLHIELYRLVMGGCYEKAVRALRLSVALLDQQSVELLKRVVGFIRCASDEAQVRLSETMSNRSAVERTFCCVVIRNRTLTPHQTGQLTMFMSDQYDVMWSVPDDVDIVIQRRLSSDRVLSSAISPLGVTFCQPISEMEYMEERNSWTERSLVELMNSILDDTRMSLKVKKHHMKLFAKHHSKLYLKHFPNMI